MQTRYMERANSMSIGKRNLEGGDDDQPKRKRPALASWVVKTVVVLHVCFVAIIGREKMRVSDSLREVVNDGGMGGEFLLTCNNEEENGRLNAKSYIGIIEGSLRYMHKLIKKRMHSMDVDSTFHPIFQVEKRKVEWLGLVAYIQVLKRKQSWYKELLSLLRSRLIVQEKEKCVSSILKDAVDESRSSMMRKITY
ncbi:hypothetical protein TEA_003449 [Camellia sinensis var. sinensis]|uniref:Telomerase reverse transcriptase n=1 Tax=Camellia sinensis var. sinensis TaxID=542762 RepID=A0A4S4DE03_CAMSN|nr:hypothetical protein TEA_003449 [Camellia sinensis var. sinensis]